MYTEVLKFDLKNDTGADLLGVSKENKAIFKGESSKMKNINPPVFFECDDPNQEPVALMHLNNPPPKEAVEKD